MKEALSCSRPMEKSIWKTWFTRLAKGEEQLSKALLQLRMNRRVHPGVGLLFLLKDDFGLLISSPDPFLTPQIFIRQFPAHEFNGINL